MKNPPVASPLEEVVNLLDLERIEEDIFRGRSPETSRQRVFGGQVAGQALVAAGRTVPPERPVHSLHAYFLRPGDPAVPIIYTVDRIRDGRSFTTRRVVAVQHGKAIFNLSASFTIAAAGVEHQDRMPAVPEPESLPTLPERLAPWAGQPAGLLARQLAIDTRYVGDPPVVAQAAGPRRMGGPPAQQAGSQVWVRADGRLPDDPLLHVCLLTYASDMTLLDSVLLSHGLAWEVGMSGTSLDHAMWFHRPFRADEWLLYDQHSPAAAGQRGLAIGRVFTRTGELAVTVVQEGLIRTAGTR
ncbi:MAG: acyl-CoA thioesterase II [Mycobacteriales bacterium]